MRQIIFTLMCFTTPLWAAIVHEVDTTRPLCCNFSSQHHNRILVDQGRVKKIIFPEEKLFVRMEEVSGQVFIRAKHHLQDDILLSVITQDGLVQDVEVSFSDCPAQIIVLKESPPVCMEQKIAEVPSNDFCKSFDGPIEAIQRGEIPDGYRATPFKQCMWRPKASIRAKLIGQLEGCGENLMLYELSNTSRLKKKISKQDLSSTNTLWTYINEPCLRARSKTWAIVAAGYE